MNDRGEAVGWRDESEKPQPLDSDPELLIRFTPLRDGVDDLSTLHAKADALIAALDRNTAARALALAAEELKAVLESERCDACGHRIVFHHYRGNSDECQVEGCTCAI